MARTAFISSTLTCFFSSVRSAASFFISYIRVPAASSSMPRISGGFMFSTCAAACARLRERAAGRARGCGRRGARTAHSCKRHVAPAPACGCRRRRPALRLHRCGRGDGARGAAAGARALVMRPCMMRKCGLLTLSCTEWNRFCTRLRARRGARHGTRAEAQRVG